MTNTPWSVRRRRNFAIDITRKTGESLAL